MKAFISENLLSKVKPQAQSYDIWDTKLSGFILRVSPTGNMVYRCEYARGKRITLGKTTILPIDEARKEAQAILLNVNKGEMPSNETKKQKLHTLEQFINLEYSEWKISNYKNGYSDIARIKANFIAPLGQLLLKDITILDIDKWRTDRIKNGLKPKTVNRDISTLKTAFNKALEWHYINVNPLDKIKPVKSADELRVKYLTEDEEQRLYNALKARDEKIKSERSSANLWRKERGYELLQDLSFLAYADHLTPMVTISLNTGLRRGALLQLRWEDINFERAILTAIASKAKTGKSTHIPLNKTALGVLKKWKEQALSDTWVFLNPNTGKPFGGLTKAWKAVLKVAQIKDFRWHDMRHHFASKLVMASVDLNTTRELLGHSDITMTLRYAHLAPEHKAEAVARLDK